MAKDYAKQFYNSTAWKKCRAGYIKSVHGLCERCGKPGWIVHHKKYITPENINDPNITLNWSNLEYVCQDCHNKEHFEKHSPVRAGLAFDESGNLIKK
jgi:5-methylcytosine-specific restriction enzyme A